MLAKVKQFLQHVIPAIIRPLHVLWNEVIGFVFIALAVWSVPSSFRAYRAWAESGDPDSLFRMLLAGIFAVIMLWFGVSSFLRARKIRRT